MERILTIREEIEKYGTDSVETIELVSELIDLRVETVLELVDEFGTIQKACLNAYSERGKITPTKAYQLNLLGEILMRNTHSSPDENPKIDSPDAIADLYMNEYRYLEVEHFDVLLLNTKNDVIKKVNTSKGTLNASIVHPRDVFKEAIKHNANAIILIHNHPSGNPSPSPEDFAITDRLVKVGELMKIKVLDHIIFGNNSFYSLKQRGEM